MVGTIDRTIPENKGPSAPTANAAAKKEEPPKVDPADKKAAQAIHNKLHDKPDQIRNYNFKKVQAGDADLSADINAILKRYNIGDDKQKYNNAVLSEDGKTLSIVSDGQTLLKQSCGGANTFSRFFGVTFAWVSRLRGVDKRILTKRYKELFNFAEKNDPNHMLHESLRHLYKGLASNHYHGVTIFHKDEKTGKFKKPAAIGIVDSYLKLIEAQEKNMLSKERKEQLAAMKENMAKYYGLDKIIPLSDSAQELNDVFHQIAESLYQAQGFDLLTIPGKIHASPNVSSNDLNYTAIPSFRTAETNEKKVKSYGDPALLQEDYFRSPQEMQTFKENLIPDKYELTYVRPAAEEKTKIDRKAAWVDGWQQMYSGGTLRIKNAADKDLFERADKINSKLIDKHNIQHQIAEEVTEDLETPKKPEDDKQGMLKKLMASLGAGAKKKN